MSFSRACLLSLLLALAGRELPAQNPPSHWMDEGALALRKGNPQAAEEDFRQELAANPASADAYLGVGLAQLRQGKLEPAEASLARAIELNPSLPSAHMFRAIALSQMHSVEAAVAAIAEELKLQPANVEALTWQGIIQLQAGRPKLAAAALDRAGALRSSDQNILYYQVRAHTLAAQESFRALFQIDPDSALVHRAQAEIYAESEQPEKAIAEYRAALKRTPSDPELYEALGEQEQKLSHPGEAAEAYRSELALNPGSSIALFNLGKIQVETGHAEQGIALLKQAVDAHAVAAPTDFYLGLGYAKAGDNENAARWLEAALAASPSDYLRQRSCYELVRVYQKLNRKADSEKALEELKRLKARNAPNVDSQHP